MKNTGVLSRAAAVCLLLAACSSDPTATTGSTTPTGQDGEVHMADIAFTPASVTVTPGSTVRWSNDDSVPHMVSFGEEGPASSEIIDPGGAFETTFEETGSYAYVCTLHPEMAGVVEVTNTQAAAAGTDSNTTSSVGTSAAASEAAVEVPADEAPVTVEAATGADGVQLPGGGTPGVDIAQGEWALVASVAEAPPGTITFRFLNHGTVPHALRIRTPGSGGDRLEWRAEAIGPGGSGLLVADLAAGTYEIDCPIEDAHGEHDQLGMEMLFTVRDGAAQLRPLPGTGNGTGPSGPEPSGAAVGIAAFAFEPSELRVAVGAPVTWSNADPAPHTVTGEGFDTGPLEPGSTGTVTFGSAGIFDYFCAIHPTMTGRVVVEA